MTVAFLFTGQGSPTPGGGAAWRHHGAWDLVEQLDAAVDAPLVHLLLDAGEDELVDTANAQLATFTLSLLSWRALSEAGVEAADVAGHSLGEYTALVAADALTPAGAAALVSARGAAMRDACAARAGVMTAIIGLDATEVADACREAGGDVWVANDNAPGQVVIAGGVDAVEAAATVAQGRGARRPIPLKVAGAFHTPLMEPAQARLDTALAGATFTATSATPWANVDASAHPDPADWGTLLSRQLCSPVRWRDEIDAMAAAGVDTFVELGPGSVLSGMVKRIAPQARRLQVNGPDQVGDVAAQLGW